MDSALSGKKKISNLRPYTHSVDDSQASCKATEPTGILHHETCSKWILDEIEALLSAFRPNWKFIRLPCPQAKCLQSNF
jgi:hypothetical protein